MCQYFESSTLKHSKKHMMFSLKIAVAVVSFFKLVWLLWKLLLAASLSLHVYPFHFNTKRSDAGIYNVCIWKVV